MGFDGGFVDGLDAVGNVIGGKGGGMAFASLPAALKVISSSRSHFYTLISGLCTLSSAVNDGSDGVGKAADIVHSYLESGIPVLESLAGGTPTIISNS